MWRVYADYHTHTCYSRGAGTIRDNARAAKEQGLEVLGIADHAPANWGHLGTTDLKVFQQIMVETKKIEAEFSGLKILAGTEADIISYAGELDIPLSLQRKLDQVLAGFHITIIPKSTAEGFHFLSGRVLGLLSPSLKRKARNENTKAMVAAVYTNEIDIITHPGLHISIDTPELARACVKRNTALEINARHGIKSVAFVKAAAKAGAKFVIGSDAHDPRNVGRLEGGIKSAQLAGLTVDQVINARDEK